MAAASSSIAQLSGRLGLLVVTLLLISGCSYQSLAPVEQHYQEFATRPPRKNTVVVCSAYGCRHQTAFRFTKDDIAVLKRQMTVARGADSPEGERRAIARTLAWMEKRVGDTVGTSADRPGDDFEGYGDPTQMDCVDVATNLTSYLLVLESNGLLKRHTVGAIIVKEDWRRGLDGWPHYAAVLVEAESKRRYAVDGWKLASGVEPEIIETDKWYVENTMLSFQN